MTTRSRPTPVALVRAALCLAFALTACDPGGVSLDDDAGLSDAPDAGDATLDAGDATPDAGDGTPDAGDATPDAGDATPDAGSDPIPPVLEVVGEWNDNFGGSSRIEPRTWDTMTIVRGDNTTNTAITRNSEAAEFNPGLFNKLVWTEPAADGTFFLCWVDFGLATADAAASTPNTADANALETTGCGGFPWTRHAVKPLEVRGDWDDNFGGRLLVNDTWGGDRVRAVDGTANWVVAQSPATAEFNPSKFNRITWTEKAQDGSFYACWSDFGLDTALDALASTTVVDATNPATGGCGGFPWTKYVPHVDNTALAITGRWRDNFGDIHTITNTSWEIAGFGGAEAIVSFDNAAKSFIHQQGADPIVFPNPGTYSRTHWLPDGNDLFICTIVTNQPTVDAARTASGTLNTSAPATSGCGIDPWTRLVPVN